MTDVAVLDEMYRAGSEDAAATKANMDAMLSDAQGVGAILMAKHFNEYTDLVKYLMIDRVHKSKEYKELGMTFAEFCDAVGEPIRTVTRVLSELQAMIQRANQQSIRHLGLDMARSISRALAAGAADIGDGDTIVIDGEPIPLSDKTGLSTALGRLSEKQKQSEERMQKKITRLERISAAGHSVEVKALEKERDALLKENRRLLSFVPEEEGGGTGWDDAKLAEIIRAAGDFAAIARKLIAQPDDRLAADRSLQGRISGILTTVEGMFTDLRREFESRFSIDDLSI